MNDAMPDFDDPHLRQTLRRALGGAAAEASLQARMAALVARECGTTVAPAAAAPPSSVPRYRWRPAVRWVAAAAAVLLVAVATTAFLWHRHHLAEEYEEYLAANLPLFKQMITAHDAAASGAGFPNPTTLPTGDRKALRDALSAKLGRDVPVPDWGDKGWRLTAAAIGPVGSHPAAQLRYENANRTLLFVSLPAAAYTGEEGEEPEPYQYAVDGHEIAGIVSRGGLHCMVGDRNVTAKEIAGLKIE